MHTRTRSKPSALAVLNLALLAVLAAVAIAPRATAQPDSPTNPRARGEYTLVGGETNSGNSNAIYVLDTANREMIAMKWNQSTSQLQGIGYRDLSMDVFAEPDR